MAVAPLPQASVSMPTAVAPSSASGALLPLLVPLRSHVICAIAGVAKRTIDAAMAVVIDPVVSASLDFMVSFPC